MQRFTIRHIEMLTGIKAHTLRIWEQRYGFFKAQRKESKQRFYDNDDLKKLLCISFLYHNGLKVSKIAAKTDEEVRILVEQTPVTENNYSTHIQKLLNYALAFNETDFLQLMDEVAARVGFSKLIIGVCYPFLQRVGVLWSSNNLLPAQEHFSTHLIQRRIIAETEKSAQQQTGNPELILFCAEKEHHELPLLFLNYLLRKEGWKVLYLGSNTSVADLEEAARFTDIRFIYLHTVTNFTGFTIDDYLETLLKSFPDVTIVASGRGLQQNQRTFVGIELLKTEKDIYQFIESRTQRLGNT